MTANGLNSADNAGMPPPVKAERGRGIIQKVATLTKVGLIGLLVLILLIPLGMIRSVMHERQNRYYEAVEEVTSTWGKDQMLAGPFLVVPYNYTRTVQSAGKDGRMQAIQETAVAYAHFLPETLGVTGALKSTELKRGIYKAVVFGGDVVVSGTFAKPDLSEFRVADVDILWDESYLTVSVSDLRGTREEVAVIWDGIKLKASPGCKLAGAKMGVTAPLSSGGLVKEEMPFEMKLSLNGSGGIRFAPLGKQTRVELKSDWPDPSFQGGILPTSRTVTESGFEALWEMSYYGRSYPQQWTTADNQRKITYSDMTESLFGVNLINVVDSYRLVERSIKYGMLFIVLVFTAFFLFEVMSKAKVHPFQYVLVGAALCLFYMAVLSLSEITSFGIAYLIGGTASTLMVSLYSAKVLKAARRAGVKIFAGLAVVYGILYVILCQQDYSLIYGTVGLFAALALVMYTTRNVDWYTKDRE